MYVNKAPHILIQTTATLGLYYRSALASSIRRQHNVAKAKCNLTPCVDFLP